AMPQRRAVRTIESHGEAPLPRGGDGASAAPQGTVTRAGPRVGRNDPCPCGSGKKYKKCHLPLEEGAPVSD
ncbi:MAG TPA: SEC-C metal-binding domain-containing protein, partial [Myxococcales bacterium]|nr:SEC-C metal-binding domain-containing protein [Myxococcales bacterium]